MKNNSSKTFISLNLEQNIVESENTAMVVWGSNLNSTVKAGRFTKIVKNMIALAPYQKV